MLGIKIVGMKFRKEVMKFEGKANKGSSLVENKEPALIHVNTGSAIPMYANASMEKFVFPNLHIPTINKSNMAIDNLNNIVLIFILCVSIRYMIYDIIGISIYIREPRPSSIVENSIIENKK